MRDWNTALIFGLPLIFLIVGVFAGKSLKDIQYSVHINSYITYNTKINFNLFVFKDWVQELLYRNILIIIFLFQLSIVY